MPRVVTMLIGEVSQQSGISARMLRHYDSLGLVSPTGRTAGGYRDYSPSDIRRLFHVESLRSLGLSLGELRAALDDPGFTPSSLVGELIEQTRQRIARDEELLRRLRHVAESGPAEWTDVLRSVSLMRGLNSIDPSRRQRSALSAADGAEPPVTLLAEAMLGEENLNVSGALRWALRRSAGEALEVLGRALDSADPDTRRRAVAAIADLDTEESTTLLAGALGHADPAVRGSAALALGARGEVGAFPALVAMVISGDRDVEAGEALGALARRHGVVDRTAETIVEELGRPGAAPDARLRLTQALAELPSAVARRALLALAHDPERRVALTATYIANRGGQ